MYQQLDIFSFLDKPTEAKTFNPIEEFALRGSGFANGKKRIQNFFLSNNGISDRVKFLKMNMELAVLGCLATSLL